MLGLMSRSAGQALAGRLVMPRALPRRTTGIRGVVLAACLAVPGGGGFGLASFIAGAAGPERTLSSGALATTLSAAAALSSAAAPSSTHGASSPAPGEPSSAFAVTLSIRVLDPAERPAPAARIICLDPPGEPVPVG